MTHIVTAREYVDRAAVSPKYSGQELLVFMVLADVVDALKVNVHSVDSLAINQLTEDQKGAALGILLALVVGHEVAQDRREGVCA